MKIQEERFMDRRLKANKGWREQARKATDELGLWPREGGVYERMEPWKDVKDVKDGELVLNVELNRKISKDMAEVVRKGVVEETLEKYGLHRWFGGRRSPKWRSGMCSEHFG